MTIVQRRYPTPQSCNGHVERYRDNAPDHKVPRQTRDVEIASLLSKIESKPNFNPHLDFDPSVHLVFDPEYFKKTLSLDDLKIKKTHVPRVSNFGAALPFPLLSEEAVDMILYEAFQDEVIDDFARLPNLAVNSTRLDFHIGGHARDHAPFTKAVVESPQISNIVSEFVGLSMSPIYNSETAHLNVSLATQDPTEQLDFPSTREQVEAKLKEQDLGDASQIPSSLGLHYDSTTLALVIMLELPEDAIGGQTTIVTGDEETVRIPEPMIGYATLIQGRILKHLASKPVTNHNRITFVNGYAVTGPEMLDNTALTSTKPSVLPRARFDLFYRDWVEYRFSKLEAHLAYLKKKVVEDYHAGRGFNDAVFVEKCLDIERYVRQTYDEMECVNNPPYPPPLFNTPYNDLP
ncbi:hypothetical protein BOH78_3501 [Pichia kudriavzevii]|uniref:Fe2OG dioxygenase domain-containing protein n=1 Tax=Pichia kudriavzevii TaxID=4909 RepID=A0A1V2LKE8_PICKU|nr:hypothetical protein BOH78_3501 [Pichia kudriavzevii]